MCENCQKTDPGFVADMEQRYAEARSMIVGRVRAAAVAAQHGHLVMAPTWVGMLGTLADDARESWNPAQMPNVTALCIEMLARVELHNPNWQFRLPPLPCGAGALPSVPHPDLLDTRGDEFSCTMVAISESADDCNLPPDKRWDAARRKVAEAASNLAIAGGSLIIDPLALIVDVATSLLIVHTDYVAAHPAVAKVANDGDAVRNM
jgi:hypothetical protein